MLKHLPFFADMDIQTMEVTELYEVRIANRVRALENLSANVDISSAWESVSENMKTLAKVSHYNCE
jgi:hypothetical protein